jgi:hypothetical protein
VRSRSPKVRCLRFFTVLWTRFQSTACQSRMSPEVTFAARCSDLFPLVSVPIQRPLGRSPGSRQHPFGLRHRALSGGLWIPRAFRRTGVRFLSPPVPAAGLPALAIRLLDGSRPQRGCHVPHRQDASGELASLCRERGTVSAGPLTPTDPDSFKDVSVTCVPLMHYGASTKALRVFNSVPTFPRRDFRYDSLLSLCFYCLLETSQLPATPRQYGNRHLVLTWSDLASFRFQTLDLCDFVSH